MKSSSGKKRGFTLIELAVILVIVSILGGGGLLSVKKLQDGNARKTTEINLNKIKDSLALFVMKNGRLPCPSADVFGTERTPVCTGSNAFGFVPWRTLGLARGRVVDGWGNFINYAVDDVLSDDASLAMECTNDNLQTNAVSSIDVRDSSNSAPSSPSAKAAYVLISHGENSLGAIQENGVAYAEVPTQANQPEEWQNTSAGSSTVFYYESVNTIGFDDILKFKTASAVLSDTGCKYVADVYEDAEAGGGGGEEPPPEPEPDPDPGQIMFDGDADGDGTPDVMEFIDTPRDTRKKLKGVDVSGSGTEDDPYTMTMGESGGRYRSCTWWPDAIDAENKAVRAYFKFAFDKDNSAFGLKGHGFTMAFLPGSASVSEETCGSSGQSLGYAGSGADSLPNPKFAVEVDSLMSLLSGYYDSINNHVAIDFEDVTHTADAGPRCRESILFFPVPGEGVPGLGQGCYPGPELTWLEDGAALFHQMRVEIHFPGYASDAGYSDAGNTCAGDGKPYMKAWVWKYDESCSDCDDLASDFEGNPTVAWCLPVPEAGQSTLKFGFTFGSSNSSSTVKIQDFGIGSYDP